MIKTMKRILLLCLLHCFMLGFSQKLRPVAQKVSDYHIGKIDAQKYDLFEANPTSDKLGELNKKLIKQ